MVTETKKGMTKLKDPKLELFCRLYSGYHTQNFFGNGQDSWAFAFNYQPRLDEIEKKLKLEENKRLRKVWTQEKFGIENNCRSSASRALTKVNVLDRVNHLMDKFITHDVMDRELAFVSLQRGDLRAKVAAIQEYNKKSGRIASKLEGNFTIGWEEEEGKKSSGKKKVLKANVKIDTGSDIDVQFEE